MTTLAKSKRNFRSTNGRRLIGYAWPTGRPIYTYTPAEIAEGIDLYTRFLKRRSAHGEGVGQDAS